MNKLARIGGASLSPYALDADIPWEHKKKAYEEYLAAKGSEQPTGLGKSLLVGGGIGAGIGALGGAATTGGWGGAGIGALLGGGIGAGMGGMARSWDKRDIAHAQEAAKDPESHLVREVMGSHQRKQEAEESDRHQQRAHNAALLAHVLTSDRGGREVHHHYGGSGAQRGDNDAGARKPLIYGDHDRGSIDNDTDNWKKRPTWARDDDAWGRAVRETEGVGTKESSAPNYVRQYVIEKLALSGQAITGAIGNRMASLGRMTPGIGQTALASRTASQLNGIGSRVAAQNSAAFGAVRSAAEQGAGARRIQGLSNNLNAADARASSVFQHANAARMDPAMQGHQNILHDYRVQPRVSPLERPAAPLTAPALRIAG